MLSFKNVASLFLLSAVFSLTAYSDYSSKSEDEGTVKDWITGKRPTPGLYPESSGIRTIKTSKGTNVTMKPLRSNTWEFTAVTASGDVQTYVAQYNTDSNTTKFTDQNTSITFKLDGTPDVAAFSFF